MTSFERYLVDEKGYIMYILNMKTGKFEIPERHSISSISNLDQRYIHKDDKEFLDYINNGVRHTEMSQDVLSRQIVFGLSEYEKPPTLISPRPKIRILRTKEDGTVSVENEAYDDSMNVILEHISPEKIYFAMYNPKKTLIVKTK